MSEVQSGWLVQLWPLDVASPLDQMSEMPFEAELFQSVEAPVSQKIPPSG